MYNDSYRDKKGYNESNYFEDYCLVDLETTGIIIKEAKIIEIAAVKVRKNVIVDKFNTLINPCCHIPDAATRVNHITDEMVKNAPIISDVIDDFLRFVGSDIIVGYNIASFDMNILYDVIENEKNISFSNNYIDLLYIARRSISDISNYKLETLSNYFKLDVIGEHRALKDCYLTKMCYEAIYKKYGDNLFTNNCIAKKDSSGINLNSNETNAIKGLINLLTSITNDGKVTDEEFLRLKKFVDDFREYSNCYPFSHVIRAIDSVLEDGIIDNSELADLQLIVSEIIDPVKNNKNHSKKFSLNSKHFCITGNFEFGSRDEVISFIETRGGIVDDIVKKSTTDYLIVGSYGSEKWKTEKFGGKIQKAMEYNSKGSTIEII